MKLSAFALLCACVVSAASPHHHRRPAHSRASVSSLRGRLANVRTKKAVLRAELRKTKRQSHQVLGDIRQVDSKISDVGDRLRDTTDRLSGARSEQDRIGLELAADAARVDRLREQVRRRLRAMYIRPNESAMAALLSSRSIGDLASRGYLMRTVARRDQAMFFQFRTLKAQVAVRKARQDALVVEIAGLAGRQKSQKVELAQTREEKAEILEGLKAKQGNIEESLAQFEADERNISAQIAAFAVRPRTGGARSLPAFTGRFIRPVNGRISDTFGMRYHPILHINRMHYGVDFAAPEGTPIHAAGDGQVISTTYMRGYGNVVILDHGGGISTVYAHCSRFLCHSGETVHRGQEIAAVGMTGLATGPHCHFELRINGHAVNPLGHL